ncbi:MAG: hypothetical protein ACXWV8_07990 [Chitinophagaceae bacterium]
MKKSTLLIRILSFLLLSCSKSKPEKDSPACNEIAKTFTTNVNPIIQTYCNQPSCHTSGSVNGPGPLTNYTQVFNARSVIRNAIQSGLMPQNATLTTAQRNTIICWIDNGAPDN